MKDTSIHLQEHLSCHAPITVDNILHSKVCLITSSHWPHSVKFYILWNTFQNILMNQGCDFIILNCSLVAITMLTHVAYRNDPPYLSTSWIISTVCNYLYIAWTLLKYRRPLFGKEKRTKWNVKDLVEIKKRTEWSVQCKKDYTISVKKERLSLEIWWGYGKYYFNQVLISFHTLIGPHCKLPNKEFFTKTLWNTICKYFFAPIMLWYLFYPRYVYTNSTSL